MRSNPVDYTEPKIDRSYRKTSYSEIISYTGVFSLVSVSL